jgi:hypothetical protein
MFSADGIFRTDKWRVKRLRGGNQRVIMPRRCDALDGLLSMTDHVPKYMRVPDICRLEIVE